MGTDYQENCTPGTNKKIFLKKSVPLVQMEKISQFLPKNGQKMAKIGQKWPIILDKNFCTPGTPKIWGKKNLYPGYTKKYLGQKICTPGTPKKIWAKKIFGASGGAA